MATAADKKAKIGVLGASGYTGAELVRLLLRHPRVEIALLTADRRAGQEMRQVFPQFSPFALPKLQSIEGIDWAGAGLDLDLLRAAARHHAEGDQADLRQRCPKTKVVDLSADFRLADPAAYARWYGHEHHAPELQKRGGLRPGRGLSRRRSGRARLVANPGCYTTCAAASAHSAAAGPRRSIPTRS